jgi:hypothetical protein
MHPSHECTNESKMLFIRAFVAINPIRPYS